MQTGTRGFGAMAEKGTGGGGVAAREGAVINGIGGRFVTSEELTEKQAAFVQFYLANGENGPAAAASAGYSNADSEAYRLTRHPVIWGAILEAQRRQAVRMRAVGIRTLLRIAEDRGTPPECARAVANDLIAHGDRWANDGTAPASEPGRSG
jgi:hypothetical protein